MATVVEQRGRPGDRRPPAAETLALLKRVAFLADLDDGALAEVGRAGSVLAVADGERLVTELEAGDEIYLLLEGRIAITISGGGSAAPRHVAWLEPGASIGEVAAFTGELRSATARMHGAGRVLAFERDTFRDLCRRFPRIALRMSKVLAQRHQETDRAIAERLSSEVAADAARVEARRGPSLRRAWHELVRNRRRELPFLLLASFVIGLLVAHGSVWLVRRTGVPLLPLLRTFYLGGLGVTALASLLALLYFRPHLRRAICIAYGAGLAFVVNEFSVFIAFDVFYLDMTTLDPKLEFNVALLYDRSESFYAVTLILALALQATYLRRFYRRLAFAVGVRARGLLRRLAR